MVRKIVIIKNFEDDGYHEFFVQKKNKPGAPYGNKRGAEKKRLISFEELGLFEGTSGANLAEKLRRKQIHISAYVGNLLRDYAKKIELKLATIAVSPNKKDRNMSVEVFTREILEEVYAENPHLKSNKKKENEKTE